MLESTEIRLAAILYDRISLKPENFDLLTAEIEDDLSSGGLDPSTRAFLERLFVKLVPQADLKDDEDKYGFEEFGYPIGLTAWDLQFLEREPISFLERMMEGDTSSYYPLGNPPYKVIEIVYPKLSDENIREEVNTFEILITITAQDLDIVQNTSWAKIAKLVGTAENHSFRNKLRKCLAEEQLKSDSNAAQRAASLMHKEILRFGLDEAKKISKARKKNLTVTTLGLAIGWIPIAGQILTAIIGGSEERILRNRKARIEWIQIVDEIIKEN